MDQANQRNFKTYQVKTKNNLPLLIAGLSLLKLLFHLLTNTNYGLHRDEYLYFEEGQQLAWGFMEVPPLTPFFGLLADCLGGSPFAIRLFPALVGACTIALAGLLVRQLGGKLWAVLITCGGLLFSPALLATNTLFQPVSFNQFFWFLCAYWLVRIVQTSESKFWYYLGMSMGVGFLAKYSIVFYGLGMLLALLLTSERKWLASRYPYLALLIALLIASPNLVWQYQHNFPVLSHMDELRETQLVHVNWLGFLSAQLLFHFSLSLIWLAGLLALFRRPEFKPYRFVGIGFLLSIGLIALLGGKDYYTIGAFTILFPFGGLALEAVLRKPWHRMAFLAGVIVVSLPTLPYALPVLKIDQMRQFSGYMADNWGMKSRLRWEDGQYYELPQDYADMHGWEELSQRVSKIYHALPEAKKARCMIVGGNYGHATSMSYFSEKYQLPAIRGFSSSCLIWLPNEADFDCQIWVADEIMESSDWFSSMTVVDSIHHPYARDPGYIHFRENPKQDMKKAWREAVEEMKGEFNFE